MSECVVCTANVTGRQHALEYDACGLWCYCKYQSGAGMQCCNKYSFPI